MKCIDDSSDSEGRYSGDDDLHSQPKFDMSTALHLFMSQPSSQCHINRCPSALTLPSPVVFHHLAVGSSHTQGKIQECILFVFAFCHV